MGFKIKEIGRVITGNTPAKKHGESYGSFVPFLTPRDMQKKNSSVTERYLTESGFELLKTRLCIAPSVSVSCIGSDMGKACYNEVNLVTNQQINTITDIDKSKFNPEYLYYLLSTMKEYFHSIAGGSTMPIINKTDFENIELNIPGISVQNKVSSFLSLLDLKIEVNEGAISNLEQLAQTLFKHWFVDFEFPNENGEPYKSSGGEMVESELGMIPFEWNIAGLKELGEFKNGINYSRDTTGDSQIKVCNVRNIVGEHILIKDSLDSISIDSKKAEGYLLLQGDTLIVRSASPGETVFINESKDDIIYSGFVIRFRPKKISDSEFIFFHLKKLKIELDSYSTGTTLKNLNQQILKSIKISYPDENLINQYREYIKSFINQIQELEKEINLLSDLRDTLLPKLLSGEIELPDEIEVMDDVPIP